MGTQINWNERNENEPIIFDGTKKVAEGCVVDLEYDGVTVTAEVTNCKATPWTGKITGFPNGDNDNLPELKVGATIKFEDRHVLRCAA